MKNNFRVEAEPVAEKTKANADATDWKAKYEAQAAEIASLKMQVLELEEKLKRQIEEEKEGVRQLEEQHQNELESIKEQFDKPEYFELEDKVKRLKTASSFWQEKASSYSSIIDAQERVIVLWKANSFIQPPRVI